LYELATHILDPVIDYFGMIRLTYGFCSHELGKHIKHRVAPKLDQHAAHERNSKGNLICPRLGAAIDFIVEDENMPYRPQARDDLRPLSLWVDGPELAFVGFNGRIRVNANKQNIDETRRLVQVLNVSSVQEVEHP
jgi:hypothetical protein